MSPWIGAAGECPSQEAFKLEEAFVRVSNFPRRDTLGPLAVRPTAGPSDEIFLAHNVQDTASRQPETTVLHMHGARKRLSRDFGEMIIGISVGVRFFSVLVFNMEYEQV